MSVIASLSYCSTSRLPIQARVTNATPTDSCAARLQNLPAPSRFIRALSGVKAPLTPDRPILKIAYHIQARSKKIKEYNYKLQNAVVQSMKKVQTTCTISRAQPKTGCDRAGGLTRLGGSRGLTSAPLAISVDYNPGPRVVASRSLLLSSMSKNRSRLSHYTQAMRIQSRPGRRAGIEIDINNGPQRAHALPGLSRYSLLPLLNLSTRSHRHPQGYSGTGL